MKHYTKSELKIVKDMSLPNEEAASLTKRSKQAVYCKRLTMGLIKRKSKTKSFVDNLVYKEKSKVHSNDSIQVKSVVDHIIKTKQFKKLIVGNVTIDLENQVVTIAM
jgi:N-glycosylase/DNA lyase